VDGRVGELLRWDGVPQIDVTPPPGRRLLGQPGAVLVIGPAWVEAVVAHVAVGSVADEDRFVDDHDRHVPRPRQARPQHVERQVVVGQRPRPGHVEPALVGVQVDLARRDVGRDGLVDARGRPGQAQRLQPQQVGQVAAAGDERLVQPGAEDEARVERVEGQVVAGDEGAHRLRVLLQQGVVELPAAGEGLQRDRPEDEIGLITKGYIQQQQVFGQRHDRIAQVVDDDAPAVGGAQPQGVELPGQGVAIVQEPAPRAGIAQKQDAELTGRLGPGQLMGGEHGRQVVEGQVVVLGRDFAIRQAGAAGEGAVVERQAAERVQRPGGGEGGVEQGEQQ